MNPVIKILVAEHDLQNLEMIDAELKRGGVDFVSEIVKNESNYRKAIKHFIPDVILCNYSFPSFDGATAFKIREEIAPETPFILVSGTIAEENSIELIKNGVTDFVRKDKIFALNTKLVRALKEAKERKEKSKTEQVLKQSEARLVKAQAIAKIGSWQTSLIDLQVNWSEETYNIFEVDRHNFQVTHAAFLQLVHPQDVEEVNLAFQTSFSSKSVNTIEHRIITPACLLKLLEQCWQIVFDEQGKPLTAVGTCQDITERKKTDALVKQGEAKYRSMVESSMDAILFTIKDGSVLSANAAACEIFQMTEKEICDGGREALVDLTDPRLKLLIEERIRTGKTRGELTFKRKDKTLFPGEIASVVFIDAFGEEKTSMVIRDITERKRTEEKLVAKSSELQHALDDLNKIMNASLDVICVVDSNGNFIKVSEASQTVWGYKPEELIGKSIYNFLYSEDQIHTKDFESHVMGGDNLTHFENRYIRKDGSLVSMEWSARWDAKDQLRYGVARDVTGKKEMAKAFEIERLRLQNIFLQAPTSMGILKGPEHVFEIANPLFLELIKKTDIIGKSVKEVLPETIKQGFIKLLDEVYNTGNTFSANEMLLKLDQKGNGVLVDKYVDFIYQAYRNSKNEVSGIFFFIIDVTEKVLLRKKIEDSDKQYRRIVETAQEGIWLIDENKQTTFVNKRICEMLGYTAAEMLGKDLFNFMDDEGKQIAAVSLEIQKKSGAVNLDFKFLTKTGTTVWTYLVTSSFVDEDGNYIGGLAMVTDITERRKIDESNKFKATLLNTIGQATIATDMMGKIIFWNKAASSIYGWTEEEVLGKNIIEITPTQQTKDQGEQIMQALLQGNSWEGEFMVRRKDGSEFPAFVTNSPIYDQQQQMIGIIGVSSDITERKNAEIQLKAMNENLQKQAKALAKSNAELEQFAYVASHDLQEPLRMVTSFLSLLENKYSGIIDARGKKYIGFAVDGSRRMRTIILDLLEFSRIGRLDGHKEKVDLNELVNEIQFLLQKQMDEKNASIHFQNLPVLYTEKTPLLQVFENLLSNALKYSKEFEPVCIDITATASEDHWQFAIRDNGIGIHSQFFDKIFLIFQRLHNRDEYSGTGIGLAVVKKIVESRGGKIWVESEPGIGSTFYFTILKAAVT